jgi:two-component system sensor histidine kinase/response regulator
MDGYLCKPIQAAELRQAIVPFARALEPGTTPPSYQRRPDAVLDRAAALAWVDNDLRLLRSLVELFLEECPGLLAVIRTAIEGADAAALSRAAHTLKGSVGVFGAGAAVAAAQRLEAMAKWGHLTGAAAAYADLEQSIERVKPALVELGIESD